MNAYQQISIHINRYIQIWTKMNAYQQISTNINTYQQISIHINKYIQIWLNMNAYQQISTNIITYQRISININTYIRKSPQASTNVNKYEWKSTKIDFNEQNEQISTNETKQISTSIWHKYLALAQLLFQTSSYYVNTMWKRTTRPPKNFQPSAGNAGTTNWSVDSIHINKYVQI
jgi:hypothetical protein